MRRFSLILAVATGLVATAPFAMAREDAPPPVSPTAPAPAPAKDDPNRIICTREHVVGSNRPKKVCMTAAQREEIHDRAMRTADESRRGPDRGAASASSGP